ncbi:MAG TPA: accessory factor UbiK family protein [Gammaproteobacteria bacterium]|nr:accessory factor UbiK family protein [Gammaproteobacteria bacterium]
MAFDPKILDDLAHKLADAVPPGLRAARDDMKDNFRVLLQSAFNKMDLVTREEFDVQAKVLARSREKLESLAARLAELEAELKKKT